MAYRHHPQAPASKPGPAKAGRNKVARAVIGLLVATGVGGGTWYVLGSREEPPAPIAAAQVDAGGRVTATRAPANVPDTRQSETVRGALVMPERRLLVAAELSGLSKEQLQQARTDMLARRDASGPEFGAIAAANLRLIEEAEKAR